MYRTIQWVIGTVGAVLLSSGLALAQTASSASISGTVRDANGGVLPGVTVTATQAAIGLTRSVVSDERGEYLMPSLPVGPYRLEFNLGGFRTFVQTGIVLQVNTNPTINAVLELGELSESIQVIASATLIETRNPGIGMVVDNERVVELPLNGRDPLNLVLMTGLAAPSGTLAGARGSAGSGATSTIAVAGGLPNGTAYLLDGATHNDPFNNAALPFPFPEALQEFKVETSALPARYGYHSAAVVNAVTKSGTNTVSGSLFEFLRDDALNAKDPFAAVDANGNRRSDGLNRNQFGGAIGGPILRDRLFYFGAYQRTRIRRTPASGFDFVPTAAMLAGDFTAVAAPACNAGRQLSLRSPFADNRIDPALFSAASLRLVGLMPAAANPCGQVFYDRKADSDEDVFTGKIDLTLSGRHSLFGRLQAVRYVAPTDYDGHTLMSYSASAFNNRVYSMALGDTLLFGNTVVNSLRGTINRGNFNRSHEPLFDFTDLGIAATPVLQDYLRVSASGAFTLMPAPALPTLTPTWTYEVSDDVSVVRGQHQFGLGATLIHNRYNYTSFLAASGNFTFTGQATGLGLADFLLGKAASFSAGTVGKMAIRQNYAAVYAQDNWRLTPNVTLNVGIRWEPYLPVYAEGGTITHFDRERFNAGIRSSVFPKAPPGLMFPGDDGMPGNSLARRRLWTLAPRTGIVWDPDAEGRQTLRLAYGRLYDSPHMQAYGSLPQMAPWGNTITINNMPAGWDTPWAAYPGGDPIPQLLNGPNATTEFPLGASYTTFPLDLRPTSTDQWNASYQRQVAADWMVSVNYLGNMLKNVWTANQINPAVFGPGATVANTQQRRELSLENPDAGRYFGSVQQLDPTGTSQYNAVLLQVQRRRANGFSLQTNYTIARCDTDLWTSVPGVASPAYMIPDNRETDRGKCPNSPEHTLNASLVYQMPAAGSGGFVRALTSGWQASTIVSVVSGSYFTVTTGVDTALSGQPGQRANQVLADPFMPDRSLAQWLNPAAFAAPATGTYGTMPVDAINGPGRWTVDAGLSRSFPVASYRVQIRMEVFNLLNSENPANPVSALNSSQFGQITSLSTLPRIVQFGFKYQF